MTPAFDLPLEPELLDEELDPSGPDGDWPFEAPELALA